MRATALEFRLRVAIIALVIAIGFWAPWIQAWDMGRRVSLLEWIALELSRTRLVPFAVSTVAVIVLATLIAGLGALLRVWGTACMGVGVVQHAEMRAGAVVADGPYRLVRNPLYIGTWCMVAALAFAMPPTGALFTMVLLTVFLLRLILGEEAFLAGQLGETYTAYKQRVPRLYPRLRGALPASGRTAHWGRAVLAEMGAIGVFVIFAALSWRYDNHLMLRAILINFGVSLVLRAFTFGGDDRKSAAAA
ncbi:MAG TPA: isoprenylcysteine carboxylmethyltransferase family protein [Acidobacteriaceae bacterium]|nr:isoprenylcysteine carboxylmethyltransferase family protein [Acidobacteriaceae bacterium]